jgi:hypothetical protein
MASPGRSAFRMGKLIFAMAKKPLQRSIWR